MYHHDEIDDKSWQDEANCLGVDPARVLFELDAAKGVEVNGRAAVVHCGRLTPPVTETDTCRDRHERPDGRQV